MSSGRFLAERSIEPFFHRATASPRPLASADLCLQQHLSRDKSTQTQERHDRPCRCGHLIPCRRIPGISQALTPISWSWPPPCTRTTSPAPPDAARLGPKRPRWCEPWELPASRRPRHARALSPIAAPLVARLAYPVLRASPCRLPGGTACVRARVQIACVGALLFLHLSFSDGYAAFRILCFFWPASPARKKSFGSVPEAECNPDGSPLLQVSCLCRPFPPPARTVAGRAPAAV